MVNFTLFDHNWKKELKKKKRERNDGKGCDFREVITASLAIQGYCWYIRSLTVGESGSCLGSSPKGPMVGSVAQSAVTAEQGSAQGLRPCSWLTWALWHLHRPYHFRNLRTPSGKPWQLGWGGVAGRGRRSSHGSQSAADGIWPHACICVLALECI